MNSFQFKQFTIQQNNSAMKVGTDGVLLGAWSPTTEGNILDIGSGTGLISIMLAQRTRSAKIDAVELDLSSFKESNENIRACDWSGRITVVNCAIQSYFPNKKYDLIVSNPPYFVDSTKAPKAERNTARHTDDLSYNELIASALRLLKPEGIFSLILPISSSNSFVKIAEKNQLFLSKACDVKPNRLKSAKRILMEFAIRKSDYVKEGTNCRN